MSLGPPTLPGTSTRSQEFGPARPSAAGYSSQPAMYGISNLAAYWQPYKNWQRYPHYHNGTDFAGGEGVPLLALETGKVTRSGFDSVNGGGYVIEVEIRPGTRYGFAHCSQLHASVGTIVRKGQMIARIGHTGVATGNHVHVTLEVEEWYGGVKRTLLWNPEMHMAGGPYANHARILPVYGLPKPKPPQVRKIHSLMRAIGYANIRETPGGTIVKINGANQATFPGQLFEAFTYRLDGPKYDDWRNGKDRTDWIEVRYGGKRRWVAKAFLVTVKAL